MKFEDAYKKTINLASFKFHLTRRPTKYFTFIDSIEQIELNITNLL